MSPLVIRRTILAELAAYGSGLTPGGLLELVKLKLPATTLGDIADELSWLRDHQLAAYTANPLDADDRTLRQWTITTTGELVLKK
ncbi:MAG: hypothetical protein H2172_12460 [Opitutus sp.]|nr:hypothetical protein [Opitutus sp.]MCS6248687.1 hypothetical protein [Opitutus sp.]MCS6275921.1 hypothetical protein [Opitutus sp.]MCS6301018.1 hypothetical protein [Opitutus sp.]